MFPAQTPAGRRNALSYGEPFTSASRVEVLSHIDLARLEDKVSVVRGNRCLNLYNKHAAVYRGRPNQIDHPTASAVTSVRPAITMQNQERLDPATQSPPPQRSGTSYRLPELTIPQLATEQECKRSVFSSMLEGTSKRHTPTADRGFHALTSSPIKGNLV